MAVRTSYVYRILSRRFDANGAVGLTVQVRDGSTGTILGSSEVFVNVGDGLDTIKSAVYGAIDAVVLVDAGDWATMLDQLMNRNNPIP